MSNKNQGRKGYRFFRYPPLLLFFLLGCILAFWPVHVLAFHHQNQIFARIPLEIGDHFEITYIHSVMKTPVTDVFILREDGTFLLDETKYQSFGAGLPTENFGSFVHRDGFYINGEIDRVLDEIDQRVGRFANHRVVFPGQGQIILDRHVPGGQLVTLKASYYPRILTTFSKGDETID